MVFCVSFDIGPSASRVATDIRGWIRFASKVLKASTCSSFCAIGPSTNSCKLRCEGIDQHILLLLTNCDLTDQMSWMQKNTSYLFLISATCVRLKPAHCGHFRLPLCTVCMASYLTVALIFLNSAAIAVYSASFWIFWWWCNKSLFALYPSGNIWITVHPLSWVFKSTQKWSAFRQRLHVLWSLCCLAYQFTSCA